MPDIKQREIKAIALRLSNSRTLNGQIIIGLTDTHISVVRVRLKWSDVGKWVVSDYKAEHQEADEHQHLMLPIGERPMGMIWHDLEAIIALFCEEPVASGRPVRYSELAAFLITSAPLDADLNVLLDHEMVALNRSIDSENIQIAFDRREVRLAYIEV
eukprot:FR741723.1.p1 GENE.FR741723.1~~FR741723.1.p1  ORF type:complete len:170 (+),score=12.61 FR741723.1:38-511(+)